MNKTSPPHYMLDTNTASYIIKGKPACVRQYLVDIPTSHVCISCITEAELLHGIAKRPEAKQLALTVEEFLLHVDSLDWTSETAASYAELRVNCAKLGKSLGAMDMMIAAHAKSIAATLVTNDQAFYQISSLLSLADWCKP